MRFENLRQEKGVAGLTILLSLVVMLFIIGLIVMIFTLMGVAMQDASYTSSSGTTLEETLTNVELIAGGELDATGNRSAVCTVTGIQNSTSGGGDITASNYSVVGCAITNLTTIFSTNDWIVNYTYTYEADNIATNTMNDTTQALSGVTDWFSIFIVIGAMVVLILLTVIIITAIRGSGMIDVGGGERGNIGSA